MSSVYTAGDLQPLHKCLLAFPLFITSENHDGPDYALVHFYDLGEHTLTSGTEIFVCILYVCVCVCVSVYTQLIAPTVCLCACLYFPSTQTHTHGLSLSHSHTCSCSVEACDLRWMAMTGFYLQVSTSGGSKQPENQRVRGAQIQSKKGEEREILTLEDG